MGVLSAAYKQGRLEAEGYAAMIASTTRLNTVGARLAGMDGVHAMTDVTGFGLMGHALEMARGSGASIDLWPDAPALLPGVVDLIRAGVRTGASMRNWAAYGADVELPEGYEDWRRDLMTDPQTSGGLLIAVGADDFEAVIECVRADGFDQAAVVGQVAAGPARVRIL